LWFDSRSFDVDKPLLCRENISLCKSYSFFRAFFIFTLQFTFNSIKSVSIDENPEITGVEPPEILRTPTRATLPLKKPNGKEAKKVLDEMGDNFKKLVKSPSDYLPMIKRGFANLADVNGQSEKDVISMGWKVEVTSRREREEALR
jgi:hypothetical protein